MDLMGLTQTQSLPVRTSAKADGNSALSKSPSDLFQKKLDQFSKESESQPAPQSYKKGLPNPPLQSPRRSPEMVDPKMVNEQIEPTRVDESVMKAGGPKAESVDSLTRRAAIQTFMQKMESEVGVDSTELVQALGQLSIQELAAPPEQNIEKILGFLNLEPEQQEIARTLFDQMLAQSSAVSMADYLKATDRQLSLSVMSDHQLRQQNMQKSLEQMNQKFFSGPTPAAPTQSQQLNSLDPNESVPKEQTKATPADFWPAVGTKELAAPKAAPAAQATSVLPAATPASSPNGSTLSSILQNFSVPSESGVEMATPGTAPVAPAVSTEALAPLMMPADWTGLSKVSLGRNAYGLATVPTASTGTSGLQSEMSGEATQLAAGETASPESLGLMDMGAGGESSQNASADSSQAFSELAQKSESGEFFDVEGAEFSVKADPAQAQTSPEKIAAKPASFAVSQQPTDSEQAGNVKEIITQANLLVKNGGGEMKIALNPEGMGQLNLKVSVENGQVSVEMVTESNEVKKLLEKGLGDLKATLASHKLNVDNVRVDFSGEIAKSFDHAHDQAQRQSAQNFMEQFRQDNGSWRRNMFDAQGGRMTAHPGDRGPSDDLLRVQSSKQKSAQRRLDLVA
jgi:flagellar hook-length control protein FliK